jgi:hypothetical protein
LTLPLALGIALPSLHSVKLEFRCVDRTPAILDAGKKIFEAFFEGKTNWTLKIIKGPLDTKLYGKPAKLLTAINVFNENPTYGGEKAAALLSSRCAEDGSILVVEPGVPQSGAFIAGLRQALRQKGKAPALPCPHGAPCAMPGRLSAIAPKAEPRLKAGAKAKWCHFAFDTEDAPAALHRLSATAGIPKERAVLSFLLAGPRAAPSPDIKRDQIAAQSVDVMPVRIISDMFSLSEAWGRYGCSEQGLVLIAGNRDRMSRAASGTLIAVETKSAGRDPKSGAPRFEISKSDILESPHL